MAKATVNVNLMQDVLDELDRNSQNRSRAVNNCLTRYFEIVKRGKAKLRKLLATEAEWNLIQEAVRGYFGEDPLGISLLPAQIEESIEYDALDEQWKVDASDLSTKLRALDYGTLCALAEIIYNWRTDPDGRSMFGIVTETPKANAQW